jgi:hypothetical protein
MIDIKDISGTILFSTPINEGSKRKFTLMKESYITLKFSLDNPVYFKLGDGIDDSEIGLFELIDLYKPTRNDSTGGYDYELRLDAYYWKWKNKKFFYTPDTGGSEASWNLTATLAVHLNVFLTNLSTLGYTYKGTAFEFSIDSTVENSAKLVSYDNTNLIDALTNLADTWDCEWWITDNIIHFGRCEYGDPVDFEYGVNVSSMTRSDSQSSYATRIYAFGSTKNLPTNYRPIDESLVVNGVVQKRLMLPSGTPYIDAYENMSTEEAVEDIVVFEDVYPRRVGTISEISTKEYTDTTENADGSTTKEKWNAYRFKDSGLTFSKDYVLSGVELRIVFSSGSLNGMDFAVTFNPDAKSPEEQLFEIVRNDDYGINLPNDTLKPQIGDTYVLYGFDTSLVSDTMIPAAEQELKEKALAYVEKTKIDPSTYDCKMSSEDMYNGGTQRIFAVGDKVNLINPAYFEAGRESRIIGFEYNLDYPYDNPTYTVGETASYSRLSEIEQKVDAVTYKGQTYTGSDGSGVYVIGRNDSTVFSDRNTLSSLRTLAEMADRALSRLKDDTAEGLVTFKKGFTSEEDVTVSKKITTLNLLVQKLAEIYNLNVSNVATLFQTIVKDYVSSESFVPGITGEGMKLYKALNGDWDLEVDNVVIRKGMTVFELIISKIRSVNGGLVVSPANGRVKSVSETTGSPTYYVLGIEGDMTFVADDLVRCQVFSATGTKYYWVPIDSVSGETILILKSEFPDGVVPAIGDDLVQMGNKTNTARQGVLYLTASEDGKPRFSVLDGVSSTDLTGKSKVILGCLDGITDSDFPSDAQPSGYGLWAGNVFLKGLFILRNGKSVEDELSDQITAVQTAFEIREGEINTKVTQATTAAQTATTKASEAAASATTAGEKATDATNAANNAATILQTVTQKETSINQAADAVELKATRAETAADKAETAEASINIKADGIVLQASNQAAQTAVDGVQVGGRNLLKGTKDFSGSSSIGWLTSDTYNGFSIIHGSYSGDMYADICAWYGAITPESNTEYTLSFWCKGTGGFVSYFYPSCVVSGYNSAGNSTTSADGSIATTLTSDWKRVWIVWKTGTITEVKSVLVCRILNGNEAYVCGVKFEIGNKATDWTPAPEDVDASIALRPTTTEIKAGISITSGGISVFGQALSFAGMVTFSSLDSDSQGRITTAQSTASSAASAANTAQSTANAATSTANSALSGADTANSGLSTLKNSLGGLAYLSAVSLAKLDSTIVEGGYIKTSLIDADAMITTSLLASKIAATDISTSRLTVENGARIGDLYVYNGLLSNISSTTIPLSGAYTSIGPNMLRCSYTDSYYTSGGIKYPYYRGLFVDPNSTSILVNIINNFDTTPCLTVAAKTTGTAIVATGNSTFTARTGELIEFVGNTKIGGASSGILRVSSSITLTNDYTTIIGISSSVDVTLTLPSNPTLGKYYFVRKTGSNNIYIASSSTNILSGGDYGTGYVSSVKVDYGKLYFIIWDGYHWFGSYMN